MSIFKIIALSFGSLVILFLLTKLMGNREMSQLTMFDYIVSITIGSIAADISLDLEKNLISGILAIFLYGLASYIISIVTLRSISLRRIFNGVPTVLVEKGISGKSHFRRCQTSGGYGDGKQKNHHTDLGIIGWKQNAGLSHS